MRARCSNAQSSRAGSVRVAELHINDRPIDERELGVDFLVSAVLQHPQAALTAAVHCTERIEPTTTAIQTSVEFLVAHAASFGSSTSKPSLRVTASQRRRSEENT